MTRPTNEFQAYMDNRIFERMRATHEDYQSAKAKENLIMKLSSLLTGRDNVELRIDKYAKDLLTTLMTNFVIRRGGVEYEIIEAEFYLCYDKHMDITTYPRTIAPGRFWFHDSGVDITLESYSAYKNGKVHAKRSKFGGILIRSLRRTACDEYGTDSVKYILGPLKCVDELWHDFDAFAFDANDYPILAYKPLSQAVVCFESRFYPLPEDESKRAKKLKSLNNRFENLDLSMAELESLLSRPFRAVRKDIVIDEAMQDALKIYRARKPSPCPQTWLNT